MEAGKALRKGMDAHNEGGTHSMREGAHLGRRWMHPEKEGMHSGSKVK